jgi:hypothetical protein
MASSKDAFQVKDSALLISILVALGGLLVSPVSIFYSPLSWLLQGSDQKTENSINYVDGDKGGQVHGTPDRSEFDPAGITSSSFFSMSEDDRYSVGEDSPGQQDSLFSSPEPEGSTMDSGTSVFSTVDKRGGAAILGHSDSYNRTSQGKYQGKDARPYTALSGCSAS